MGKTVGIILVVVVVGLVAAFATGLLDVNQTQEAVLPEVSVEGGQLPAAEVNAGDIEVGSETQTIEVETPTVDLVPVEENN